MIEISLRDTKDELLFSHTADYNSFKKTFLKAVEQKVSLVGLNARDQDLSGIALLNTDLSNGNFANANLSNSVWKNVNCSNSDFSCADFRWTELTEVNGIDTHFSRANFANATMKRCTFAAFFKCAIFHCIDITESCFDDSTFAQNTFFNTRFFHTQINNTVIQDVSFVHSLFRDIILDGEKINAVPLVLTYRDFFVMITPTKMRIGCTCKTHEEWKNLTNHELKKIDPNAVKQWTVGRSALLKLCATYASLEKLHEEEEKKEQNK